MRTNVRTQLTDTTLTVKRLRRLCTPADKNDEDPGAEQRQEHLACYTMLPKQQPENRTVFVNHQFGAQTLVVRRNRVELCVSSAKNVIP